MVDITLTDVPEREIQTAMVRVMHFAGQWPDRVGGPNCCIYGALDQSSSTMSVHRTPKGRLVVKGLPEKELHNG
jgi:hypothetical protein